MSRRLNVLVAEDNADDRMLLDIAFKKADVRAGVAFVTDGDEALNYLSGTGPFADRARFPFPDFMLLDLKMPRVDGFDVLEWVRQRSGCKCLPVIIYTSSVLGGDVERAFGLGANSYLVKTASSMGMVEMARALNTYWIRHNVFPDSGAAQSI